MPRRLLEAVVGAVIVFLLSVSAVVELHLWSECRATYHASTCWAEVLGDYGYPAVASREGRLTVAMVLGLALFCAGVATLDRLGRRQSALIPAALTAALMLALLWWLL